MISFSRVLTGLGVSLALCCFTWEAGAQPPTSRASVEEAGISASPIMGLMHGQTLYHISYYAGPSGIESELEFPLQSVLAGLAIEYTSANYRNEIEWRLRAKIVTNITSGSGFMKDSDWATDDIDIAEVGTAHPGKDIYSESDIDLQARMVDLTFSSTTILESHLNIGPLIQYRYQHFAYEVSNTNQVGYGPYAPAYTGYVPGKTLDYEVTYSILAFGMNIEYPAYRQLRACLQLAYAPWMSAKDRDDHILRYKLSTARTHGTAILASIQGIWEMRSDLLLTAGGEYTRIRTTGTQNQMFYAGPDAGLSFSVNDRIESEQFFVSAMLTVLFPL